MRWILAATLTATAAWAGDLRPETLAAFDSYIRQTETRLDTQKGRLWSQEAPDRSQRIRGGEVVVQPTGAKALIDVPHGFIHDWVGAAFLPDVTVSQAVAFVQDYDKHKQYYKPEVVDSRVLSHDGNHYRIFLRLLKKKVITVVLDTEHDVRYEKIDDKTWRSASRTTRISEVDNPGSRDEKVQPPDTGQGFLWRLYTYWRFQERDGGTWVECQAISLTRDVPRGLGWLIEPIVKSLPRDSLQNTLKATRAALVK